MDNLGVGLSSNNFFNLPFWVAQHRGFLAAENLQAEALRYESEAENLSWLLSGRTTFAYISTETVVSEVDAGKSLVIIGGNIQRLPFTLVGRPGIEDPRDLKGKTIGVSSLDIGTSTLLRRFLASYGLIYQVDYTMVPIGMMTRRWQLLQSGEIDAGLQAAPMDFIASEAGYTSLGDVTADIGPYQFVSLGAVAQQAQASSELTIRFLRALAQAHAWLFTHADESAQIAVTETGAEFRHARRAWDLYTQREVFPADGDVSIPGIQAVLQTSGEVRTIESRLRLDWHPYVDRSYFLRAVSPASDAVRKQ